MQLFDCAKYFFTIFGEPADQKTQGDPTEAKSLILRNYCYPVKMWIRPMVWFTTSLILGTVYYDLH